MDATKVKMRHRQANGVNQIVNFARETRRQARESFVKMTQRAIEPFSM
jgi:hypothetical protein